MPVLQGVLEAMRSADSLEHGGVRSVMNPDISFDISRDNVANSVQDGGLVPVHHEDVMVRDSGESVAIGVSSLPAMEVVRETVGTSLSVWGIRGCIVQPSRLHLKIAVREVMGHGLLMHHTSVFLDDQEGLLEACHPVAPTRRRPAAVGSESQQDLQQAPLLSLPPQRALLRPPPTRSVSELSVSSIQLLLAASQGIMAGKVTAALPPQTPVSTSEPAWVMSEKTSSAVKVTVPASAATASFVGSPDDPRSSYDPAIVHRLRGSSQLHQDAIR